MQAKPINFQGWKAMLSIGTRGNNGGNCLVIIYLFRYSNVTFSEPSFPRDSLRAKSSAVHDFCVPVFRMRVDSVDSVENLG